MSDDKTKKDGPGELGENPGYQALQRLEERGVLKLGEPIAQPKGVRRVKVVSRITSSSDPVVSNLIEIDRQIEALDGTPDLPEAIHMALHIAQDALLIAALVRGAVPGPGSDPGAHFGDTLALTHLCMLGYPATDEGKRAYVHDLLLGWVDRFEFKKREPAVQVAVAEYLGRVLAARVGKDAQVDP